MSIRGVSPGQGGGTLNATSMYMAMLEHWLGIDDLARNRLSWYVATTHVGYQPQGEAVDWTTERPRVSTSSEPVTATWYLLALFNQLGMFDRGCPETERRLP